MIEAGQWQSKARDLADQGARFLALYAAGDRENEARLTLIVEQDGLQRSFSSYSDSGRWPSLVSIFPAAKWDEREAHDLYGVEFEGHEPLRPLVDHVEEPESWMTPVEGDVVHQVAVGPIHAGVIESGHFRFHLVGERILALDLRLFYKHRGLERLAEGHNAEGSRRVMARTCAASSVSIQVAFSQCWEAHLGLRPDPELRRVRTFLIELERLYNHLNDISAICAGVGFSPGAMAFAALKERAQGLNRRLSGHRFLFETVKVGASDLEIDRAAAAQAAAEIESIAADAAALWREVLFSASVRDRMRGTGVVKATAAKRLGLVGPAARASGLTRDRRQLPGTALAYPNDLEPARLESPTGDVAARTEIRALEIDQTAAILSELVSRPMKPASCTSNGRETGGGSAVAAPVTASVEGPRGEILCALEVEAGQVLRLHLRTASYANWPAVEEAVIGDILPDFPLINKSFELSYAAVDR